MGLASWQGKPQGCVRINHGYTSFVIRNIIFDWSGTLVDDLPAVWKATNYVLTQIRARGNEPGTISRGILPAVHQILRTLRAARSMPQLEVWFHGRFKQAQDSVVELPHAREFLEFCRQKGCALFC